MPVADHLQKAYKPHAPPESQPRIGLTGDSHFLVNPTANFSAAPGPSSCHTSLPKRNPQRSLAGFPSRDSDSRRTRSLRMPERLRDLSHAPEPGDTPLCVCIRLYRGECDFTGSNPECGLGGPQTPHGFTGVASHCGTVRSLKRAIKFSVTGVCTSLCASAALAMVPTY